MTKTKKKLQDDVLFEEQDIIDINAQSSANQIDDDASLRLLNTQERILSNYELMQEKMNASEEKIARISNDLTLFKNDQDNFVKAISEKYRFIFDIKPETIEKLRNVLIKETEVFKTETHNSTVSAINRFKEVFDDKMSDIDMLRIRWWPHGYILVIIFELLFCSNIFLLMKITGRI